MPTETTMETTSHPADSVADSRKHPNYDDINTPVVVLIGFISLVVTLLTIWAVEGLYYHWYSDLVQTRKYSLENTRPIDQINAQKEQLLGVPDREYASLDSVIPQVLNKYKSEEKTDDAAGESAESSRESDAAEHQE